MHFRRSERERTSGHRASFCLKTDIQRTLEEVGKEFNVTRERIRQIEAKAAKLRNPVRRGSVFPVGYNSEMASLARSRHAWQNKGCVSSRQQGVNLKRINSKRAALRSGPFLLHFFGMKTNFVLITR